MIRPPSAQTVRSVSLHLLAALFVVGGALHFARPEAYLRIMPPGLPHPRALLLASGAFEIAGGVGVLIPRLRRSAGWGLAALLVAVFPANVYVALNPAETVGSGVPPLLLWLRLLLQPLLIVWVLWATRGREERGTNPASKRGASTI